MLARLWSPPVGRATHWMMASTRESGVFIGANFRLTDGVFGGPSLRLAPCSLVCERNLAPLARKTFCQALVWGIVVRVCIGPVI